MSFSFTGRHMEVGESLTNKAREDCKNLAQKYGTEFIDANIVMNKDGYRYHTDISVKTATGNSYFAGEVADDPKVSFEITLQKINLQMQKKRKTLRDKARTVETMEYNNSYEEKDTEDHPMIIAEILDDLPIMSVNEASQRLDENTKVFIFENVSTNAVNVVYTREDGNIGWIDYKKIG